MKKIPLSLFLILFPFFNLPAQENTLNPPGQWKSLLHIESGFMYPDGKIRDNIAVRQNISSYYVDQSSDGAVTAETYGFILGARWEYYNDKLNAGISSGLRFTGFRSEISGYSSQMAKFFYLRYSMSGSDTKFARVKKITESTNFFSIPLEVRLVPVKYRKFALFAKAGAEISIFTFGKETNIDFQEQTMEARQKEVLDNIGITSESFYSTLYGSAGISLGADNKPEYIFEIFFPSLFLSHDNFALTKTGYFSGFKFSVQFPIKKSL